MKNLFLISFLIFSLSSFSQNQTWSGTKVLNQNNPNPFKLSNVIQNNSNTRLLSWATTGKLEWVDKSTIAPNFQSVLNAGNTSTNSGAPHFYLISGTQSSQYFGGGFISGNSSNGNHLSINHIGFNNYNIDGRFSKLDFSEGLSLKTLSGGSQLNFAKIKSDLVTTPVVLQIPNNSGTILTDAPNDNQNYVRNNNNWVVSSSGGSQNLQQVTDNGSTTTNDLVVSSYMKVARHPWGGTVIGREAEVYGGVSIGEFAGAGGSNLSYSVFLGSNAGQNSNLGGGTFIGSFSGNGSTSDGTSTAVGTNSFNGQNANNVTCIGYNSGNYITNSNDLIGIGKNSLQNISNKTRVAHINIGGSNVSNVATANDQFVITSFIGNTRFNINPVNSFTYTLTDKDGTIPTLNTTAPTSSTATGVVGEIRVTSTYIYICTATNTWVRASLSTW